MKPSRLSLIAALSAITVLGACAAPVTTGVYRPHTVSHSHTHAHTHTHSQSVVRVAPAALPRCHPHGTRYHVMAASGGHFECGVFFHPVSSSAHSALMYRDQHGRAHIRDADGYWRRAPAHDHR